MMFHYPYLNFPYYGNSRYGYRFPRYNYNVSHNSYTSSNKNPKSNNNVKEDSSSKTDSMNDGETRSSSCDFCFDFMGIKLYFDDILLICLILFLYNEGVKDQSLFISLILLLLS